MDSKIICKWLSIEAWPPDHYALLGLKPGEEDASCIERQVHERMAKLRCYQLAHPEEATEGMNRVAQAFICLTEALSKADSEASQKNKAPGRANAGAAGVETQKLKKSKRHTEIDWRDTPPPVRVVAQTNTETVGPILRSKPAAETVPELPVYRPVDPVMAFAQEAPEACRGLGTLPALIERINLTRKLICAWSQAGKYMSNANRKLTKASEEIDLTRRLNKILELAVDFPKIVGHPGQPGYRVVAMARLEMTSQMFKMFDQDQRAALARDWESGYRVLLSHRRYLRSQFKGLRRRGFMQLIVKAIRSALNDHPIWVGTGVFLVIALCAVWYWKVM